MTATFKQAVQQTTVMATTANGMATLESTLHPVVDLFFAIGASRGKDISPMFAASYGADRDLTLRVLAWARDVRGGAGERGIFRAMLQYLEQVRPEDAELMLPFVAEFGRWDDLLIFSTDRLRHRAYALIDRALKNGDGLCAKWMPRKGEIAVQLRNFMGMSPKRYRKTLVTLTNVVETQMCAKQWDEIDFGKIPSLAAARYQKAFLKNAPQTYGDYKAALATGEAKINAGAVYPYDVIRSITRGDAQVAKAQWEAMPNFLGDAGYILPMVDVSGSMGCAVGGQEGDTPLTCMDAAVSIGLYLADKQKGPFADMFLTFSDKPKIEVLQGDILSKYTQMAHAHWGMSTNLEAAFDEVLRVAVQNGVAQDQMPKYLLILSDMEFNQATRSQDTAFTMARNKYQAAGYDLPKIVFWNLNARQGNNPVRFDQAGTALVSGFSPAILRSILAAKQVTPLDIMMETIMQDRYDVINRVA